MGHLRRHAREEGMKEGNFTPITHRVSQPTPDEIRLVRERVGLTQAQAAQLVSAAQNQPYRTWQGYEVDAGKPGHRTIPLATWELFLLLADHHPTHRLARRRGSGTVKSDAG